jgi:hypothetical protein
MADEARTIIADKKRLEQYYRISRLWLEEVPAVPLYQQIELYGASKRLLWKARGDEVIKAVANPAPLPLPLPMGRGRVGKALEPCSSRSVNRHHRRRQGRWQCPGPF